MSSYSHRQNWHYSSFHNQLCQVIETQTLWGENLPRLAAWARLRGPYPCLYTQGIGNLRTGLKNMLQVNSWRPIWRE